MESILATSSIGLGILLLIITEKLTNKRGYSMNEQTFWHRFEEANKYNYPIGWITNELSTKKVEDIVTFEIILE
jgi:hypothetical protein